MNIHACLTSASEHYCTPGAIVVPTRRLLVPKGSGRSLIDPWSNKASQVGANRVCDGESVDGHEAVWSSCDTSYENPPYGAKIEDCVQTSHHWHVEVGMPGVWLGPARMDTKWMQGGRKPGKAGAQGQRIVGLLESVDAWVLVQGRLTFLRPIGLRKRDCPDGDYYLQKWWPWAKVDPKDPENTQLPDGFRPVYRTKRVEGVEVQVQVPNLAIGPEVSGPKGKPARSQAAPFPSIIGFWADRAGRYGLREEGAAHPIDVKEFARFFGHLGILTVRTGEHRGVYQRGHGS